MKKTILIILVAMLNVNFVFAQETKGIYENFKRDSAAFRALQNKKLLSNQLSVYELGFKNYPGKKLNQFSQIQKQGSYVWLMKDSTSKIKLIISISQNSSDEWGTNLTILNFDENQNLKLYRHDRNTFESYSRAHVSQNWISDKNGQPCDYYFIDGQIVNKISFCNIEEITNEYQKNKIAINGGFSDISISEILTGFGIYK